MEKIFIYKVYKNGVYRGILGNITSEFSHSQDINTPGVQIKVAIGATLDDTGETTLLETLIDEDNDEVVDQNGDPIVTSVEYIFNDIPIDLGNQLDVYMSYSGAINGVRVFTGLIMDWEADYKKSTLTLTAMSWGVKLDNYFITSGEATSVAQTSENDTIYSTTRSPSSKDDNQTKIIQTWQAIADEEISAVNAKIASATGGDIQMGMYQMVGASPNLLNDVLLSESTIAVPVGSPQGVFKFTFPSPISTTTGTDYYIAASSAQYYKSFDVYASSGDLYADGQVYKADINQPAFADWDWHYTSYSGSDLYFEILSSTGGNIATYNSYDPSDILRSVLDAYIARGGLINYDASTLLNTGTSVSYTFKFNTILEAIKKCVQLAPGGWYWYVDVGTNYLHFRPKTLAVDHTLIIGAHIEQLVLKQTLDNMKNFVAFTGGEGETGTNLFTTNVNQPSITKYSQWLDRPSDNRVELEDTANIISNGILSQGSQPVFETTVNIPSEVYDIETVKMGNIIGFANGTSLVNNLRLQVVNISRAPRIITARLATLPPVQANRIEDIKRNLDQLQTINNLV